MLAARDPDDEATSELQRPADYTACLDADGLRGARIGVPGDPSDPGNDVYYGRLGLAAHAVIGAAVAALQAQGATIVRANIPAAGWLNAPGTEMAVLSRNPRSPMDLRLNDLGTRNPVTPGSASVLTESASPAHFRVLPDVFRRRATAAAAG